jgi:para-nitrobenzyl esterase
VVVTLNYRLGNLGWFALPALAAEDPRGVAGNYGLLDQLAALAWVQRNIGAFGGDRSRVLLFGQSAGAYDTCYLLTAPAANGLFSRAAMHSGGCAIDSCAPVAAASERLATALGCAAGDLTCLRDRSAPEIATTLPETFTPGGAPLAPCVDGVTLPVLPLDAIQAGRHNAMPLMLGSNADEFTTLVDGYLGGRPLATDADARTAAEAVFGVPLGDALMAHYPAADYGGSARMALVAALGDAFFHCPARRVARSLVAAQQAPVRRWFYTHAFGPGALAADGAAHGFELVRLFPLAIPGYPETAGEIALDRAMIGYWTHFAATGDPNGAGLVSWPLSGASDAYLGLDETIQAGAGVRTAACDVIDAL